VGVIQHVWPWYEPPQEAVQASPEWIARGLRSLYILDAARWRINQVTGRVGGDGVGTGPDFPNGWLRTFSNTTNYATLEHGLQTNIALPITIVVGWRRLSGVVSWSLLHNGSTQWSGWYGENTGQVKSSNANSFDGELVLSGGGSVAFAHVSATSLRGASTALTATDTTATVPAVVATPIVTLGGSRRNSANLDNVSTAEFTHFAAIQGNVSDQELIELAHNPWQLFAPRQIWVPYTAASTIPTLSAPTFVPGSLSTTGWRGRVTAT
jgi:hypothetical protein